MSPVTGYDISGAEGLCRAWSYRRFNKVCGLSQKGQLVAVGAAAKKAGVSRQSLQYYLMVGLLEPTEVTATGRRLFDSKSIDRIKLIRRLNDSGYPLRAIRELFMEGRSDLKGPKK